MTATTYRKLSEEILTTYFKGTRSDDAQYSLRFIAELIANEVAWYARKNAFENSNAGEVTYSNDTFIVTYKNKPLQTDSTLGIKYIQLSSIPTALPNNQEIQKVWPVGNQKVFFIPLSNHQLFSQSMLPSMRGFMTYYIENGNMYFPDLTPLFTANINYNMVAGFPEGNLLDAALSIPKNYETEITDKILAKLNSERNVQRDVLNDAIPMPS